MDVEIGPARPDELPAVLALLEASGLPIAGLADHGAGALVARSGGAVVGSAALELYGAEALLRSVAVERRLRGQGVGRRLALRALDLARRRGVAEVYLLTETARDYFPRLGFRPLDRAEAPASVRGSVEFASACPEGATLMVARLG